MNQIAITKYLKLPYQFDEKKLTNDLQLVLNTEWIDHFNTAGYEGTWNSIALYAPGGDAKNILAMQNEDTPIIETELIKPCYYFQEVLGQFKCPLLSVRLLNLGVGAIIKPHRDHELGYENNCFRLHIPITTNPQVEFILDDNPLPMLPGECWYTNVNYTHSVANRGTTDRVHLVFDGQRNDWSDELFYSLAPPESYRAEAQAAHSRETILQIIENLEAQENPVNNELIDSLKNQL